jgi:putative flippase GtrA
MSVLQLSRAGDDPAATVDVEIVIPVHNEEGQLAASVTTLRNYLDAAFPFSALITIVDNASTDQTGCIAAELAATLPGVESIRLRHKGRGLALRTAWSRSHAAVVAYMDVDLATGLDALLPLVSPLLSGHSDLAIGSRLATGAHVVRGTKREFISRGYNLLLRTALSSRCTDAQCGFKALRRETALELLPLVENNEWFFDTEVLVTAERIGLRIHEVPVDWVDDIDSRVDIVHTAFEDLRGVARMLGPSSGHRAPTSGTIATTPVDLDSHRPGHRDHSSRLSPGHRSGRPEGPARGPRQGDQVFSDELLRFGGIGVVSTMAYAGLFAALEGRLGTYPANALAIGLCSMGNTVAHRGMAGAARHGLGRSRRLATAGVLFGVSLSVSTAALGVTRALGLTSLAPELCAATGAGIGAAVVRFAILRRWVFRPEFGTHLASESPPFTPQPASTRTLT